MKVYVIISQTQTIVGSAIRRVTNKTYNHTSISFSPELADVYGFGRKVVWNMFSATLIKEQFIGHPHYDGTDFVIMSYDLSESDFNIMKETVEKMYDDNTYLYNYVGMITYAFGQNYRPENQYNCSQFIGYLFARVGIKVMDKNFEAILPMDFFADERFVKEYEGPIEAYATMHPEMI